MCRDYAAEVHGKFTGHQYFFPAPDDGMIPEINIYTKLPPFLAKGWDFSWRQGERPSHL